MQDVATERALLCGLVQNGKEAYIDIQDLIGPNSFTEMSNSVIFSCLSTMYEGSYEYDMPSFLSAANSLGFGDMMREPKQIEYVKSLSQMKVGLDNVRKHAVRLSKLSVIRKLQEASRQTYRDLSNLNGNESLEHILAEAEKSIFNVTMEMQTQDSGGVEFLGDNILEYIQWLRDNKCDFIGIPSPYATWNAVTGGGFRRGKVSLFGARPKVGKEQPLDSIVYTTTGPKRMGDINIGDYVCSINGAVSQVDGIFPQGLKDVYQITFCDGTQAECGLEHLWYVAKNRGGGCDYQVLSLKKILEKGLDYADRPKWKVPISDHIFFEDCDISIDPYILGCLLGDGCLSDGQAVISTSDEEILAAFEEYCTNNSLQIKHKGQYDYRISKHSNEQRSNSPNILLEHLKQYGLLGCTSHTKFIPDDYKYNSKAIRLALIQGLMDTDGSNVKDKALAEYTSVSKQLVEDVSEILRSLGYKCTIKARYTTYTGSDKQFLSYRIYISGDNVSELFRLARKTFSNQRKKERIFKKIIKVEKLEQQQECQCISVSAPDGLYVTNGMNITHNTTVGKDIGLYVADKDIPVLYLDTEMDSKDLKNKVLSCLTGIATKDIETGKFDDNEWQVNQVIAAGEYFQNSKFAYRNIAGYAFDDILSIVRRWIFQHVGFDENGNTNDCLVIYDYFKLQEAEKLKEMQETQALGFQVADMTNFAIQYDIPFAAFVQLNRSSEDIAQSDRLLWLCASFTKISRKTREEIMEDGVENGNIKFTPLEARFGPAMRDDDYINIFVNYETSAVQEKGPKSAIERDYEDGKIGDEEDDDESED